MSGQIRNVSGAERDALLARTKELAAQERGGRGDRQRGRRGLHRAHLVVPNLVEDGAPPGGEDDFVVLREVGQKPDIAEPRDHLELGELLGAIDIERGAGFGQSVLLH